jgi:hypothetical protein
VNQDAKSVHEQLIEEIRQNWLQTRGGKGLFEGEPHDEVECYFNFSYFQLKSRLLLMEMLDDPQKLMQELPRQLQEIRKELIVCAKVFDYFVKTRGAKSG